MIARPAAAGPILSIHSQPNGQRFATGGMDIKVKLWSLPVALDAQRELQERQAGKGDPRPLAVLLDHTAPVNVVRFSHGNKLLASGGRRQGPAGSCYWGASCLPTNLNQPLPPPACCWHGWQLLLGLASSPACCTHHTTLLHPAPTKHPQAQTTRWSASLSIVQGPAPLRWA